jgi:hypothetical protein
MSANRNPLPTHNTRTQAVAILLNAASNFEAAAAAMDTARGETIDAAARNADALMNAALDQMASFMGSHGSLAALFAGIVPVKVKAAAPAPAAPVETAPPVKATATVAQTAAVPQPVKVKPAAPAKVKAAPAAKVNSGLAAWRELSAKCKAAGLSGLGSTADLTERLAKHTAKPNRKAAAKVNPPAKVETAAQPPAPAAPARKPANPVDAVAAALKVNPADLVRAMAAAGVRFAVTD